MKAGTSWVALVAKVCCVVFATGSAWAQELNWAEKMLEHRKLDFGIVARGAETVKSIRVKNIYGTSVTLSNVRTSCSCASAKASHTVLQPGEEGTIEISMDTVRHMKKKESGALILFGMNGYPSIEVRIPVEVYIRTDVVLNPGVVNFDSVDVGATVEKKVHVEYAGRPDWTIKEVKFNNPSLEAKIVETLRDKSSTSNAKVTYDLTITLKGSAPVGNIREQMLLITDDQSNQIPVAVSANVESEFTITPNELSFGTLGMGQTRSMNVVIRAKKPFTIEKIECEKDHGAFKVKMPPSAATVHVLPITVVPAAGMTSLDELFTVKVGGRTEPLTIRASGRVQPATPSAN